MNNILKNKKILCLFLVISLLLITVPIIAFVINFHKNIISDRISDWGSLGDYFGGILNPIISLFSLIILGYITYVISRNTNEENKNLFLLQKKINAYEELTKYMLSLSTNPSEIKNTCIRIAKKYEIGETYFSELQELQKQINIQTEFYYFLYNFEIVYGHLFDYNFQSNHFKNLLEYSNEIQNKFDIFFQDLTNKKGNFPASELLDLVSTQFQLYAAFILIIKKQLK